MGGFGSGRWQHGKNTTNDYRRLDVRELQRKGLLTPGQSFWWQWTYNGRAKASIKIETEEKIITLIYQHKLGENWKDKYCTVFLDRTSCNFGGKRVWFICPGEKCWRRVAVLYGGANFLCRHCHKLAYPCQRETSPDRLARRANKIRRKLGWEEGILNLRDGKPKGMHWKTFDKLTYQYNLHCIASLDEMKQQLGLRD